MSGLLYTSFFRCRGYLLAGIITCAASCVAVIVLALFFPNEKSLLGVVSSVLSILTCVIIPEGLPKALENNIKCRFMNVVLSGGISAGTAALAELAANLIAVMTGAGLALVIQITSAAVTRESLSSGILIKWCGISLLFGLIAWLILPLTVVLKSQDKASLIVGIIVGFIAGIVLLLFMDSPEIMIKEAAKFLSAPVGVMCVLGGAAALYAVTYLHLWLRLKRGDVC